MQLQDIIDNIEHVTLYKYDDEAGDGHDGEQTYQAHAHDHDLNKLTDYVFDPDDPTDAYHIVAAVYHATHHAGDYAAEQHAAYFRQLHDRTAVYHDSDDGSDVSHESGADTGGDAGTGHTFWAGLAEVAGDRTWIDVAIRRLFNFHTDWRSALGLSETQEDDQ